MFQSVGIDIRENRMCNQ